MISYPHTKAHFLYEKEPMAETNDISATRQSHLFLQLLLYLLRTCRLDGVNFLLEVAFLWEQTCTQLLT